MQKRLRKMHKHVILCPLSTTVHIFIFYIATNCALFSRWGFFVDSCGQWTAFSLAKIAFLVREFLFPHEGGEFLGFITIKRPLLYLYKELLLSLHNLG